MVKVTDFAIIQRDENNEAKVYFSGKIPEGAPESAMINGWVYTEDENLGITDITECKKENGEWYIEFTLPAGGLYTFEARMVGSRSDDPYDGGRIAIVRHFGVGDLYIMAGQSNMAGYGRDAISDPATLGVHLYKNNGKWDIASHPLNDSIDTLYPENLENGNITSPALSFARYLNDKLNLPIGLVAASLGGSPLSKWHPEEEGSLYRGMMRRIPVVGKVKGILWYQGCSDANEKDSVTYYDRFKRMIELYRKELGNIEVITVQLNRWAGNRNENQEEKLKVDRNWGIVRDAQRRLALDMEKVYVVPCHDLPLSDGIHNASSSNLVIGQRMAMVALKYIYNMPASGQSAPIPRKASFVDETHFYLHFDEGFRIYTLDSRADGIDIEDEIGLIPCKNAWGHGNKMFVETERPYTLPAKLHVYWQAELPSFIAKDRIGQPVLACYGMDIEE